MAMGGGDSNLLLNSMNGTSSTIHCPYNSATVNYVVRGRPVWRLPGGFFPCLESRVLRNGSRKRSVPSIIIQASESRPSVNAPASTSKSNGSTQAQSHFDLLQRMTENSGTAASQDRAEGNLTIRDQLASQVEPEAVIVSLTNGEKEEKPDLLPEVLTISQRRNIRRQNYLNKVSERNDAPFFATVAAIILVPPIVILAVAVATGYVELFP